MSMHSVGGESRGLAIALALVSAVMWGLWWIPLRALADAGLDGLWASLAMNIGALPVYAAAILFLPRGGALSWTSASGAFLAGIAFMLYGAALNYADVVKVVLLFYLAPAWSVAIETFFMRHRLSARRVLALLLSFAGLVVILRGDLSLSGFGIGEVMALGSGVAWAAGAALMFTAAMPNMGWLGIVSVAGAIMTTGAIMVLGGSATASGGDANISAMQALAGLGAGMMYFAPLILITLWSALRLAPATMSFLLTAEIVSGVGSSALLLDEPFGAFEAVGATLIILAGLIEVIVPPERRVPT